MYGRDFVKVPYNEDLTMDVNNILKELTDDTQLLILLNPNNPMGNVYTEEEFERMDEPVMQLKENESEDAECQTGQKETSDSVENGKT